MTTFPAYRSADLAWSVSEAEDQRYRLILKRTLQILLALAILFTLLPLPKPDRQKTEELPPRLARLLLERQPPPPPVKAPEPELKKPEAKQPEARKPEPKKQTLEAARAKAERSGLLAFKDELSDLRSLSTSKLDKPELAKGPVAAAGPAGRGADRALITSSATRGSGGISTSRLSRDTGGGGLGDRSTGAVASPVGDGGGDGKFTRGGSGKAGRSLEEIKLVFDRNKGSIYTLYNRALRDDPSLQGKVVLRLTIAPSGKVLEIAIVSSELRNPDLERKLLARIKQFDFGAKDVDTLIVTYPVDFLPS